MTSNIGPAEQAEMVKSGAFRRLECAEGGHRYRVLDREVPGLTTVLEVMGFSDFGRIPKEVLDRKARLGTAVHKATEMYDLKTLDYDSLHPAIKPYVDAYIDFVSKLDIRTRFNEKGWDRIEEPCHVNYGVLGSGNQSPLEFGCTIDRKGILPGEDHLGVLELKCTAKAEKSHELQTAAQADTIEPYKFHPRFCLYLKPDGKFKLEKHKNHAQDGLAWRQVLASYYWKGIYA